MSADPRRILVVGQHDYALVLADLKMRELNGPTFYRS